MAIRSILQKFNRGEVSPLALARDDLTKVEDSCELMNNFMPMRLGPMSYRPGFEYIGAAEAPTTDSLNRALIPLTRSTGDTVLFEFAGTTMRPLVDGLPIAVSADTISFTNENFTTDITTGWTNSGVSHSALYSGSAFLTSNDYIYQTSGAVTIGETQSFKITVHSGPILINIGDGSSMGSNDLIDMVLYPGVQYLQFIPQTTQFTITFRSVDSAFGDGLPVTYLGSCVGVTSGNVEFTVDDVDYRVASYDASADVMFLALGNDSHPKVIRRHGVSSYTCEDYFFLNGPYGSINNTDIGVEQNTHINLAVITADANLFKTEHDERLIKIVFPEMTVKHSFSATGTSGEVGVRGEGSDRELLITITGGAGTTLELQRFNDKTSAYETIRTYVGADTDIISDRLDGELKYYRFECTTYGAAAEIEINYVSTKAFGYGRITDINSATSADVNVYQSLIYTASEVTPTVYWYLGSWYPGNYPQGVTIYEGRVVWVGKNKLWATVTDDYYNFDREIEGDSASIERTIGFGPVDDIAWVESAGRLFMGLPTTEIVVRSNSYDDPLTPFNTNLKAGKGVGSKAVRALGVDDSIYHVSRDGKRIHRLQHEITNDNKVSHDQMMLHPDICEDGIVAMAVSQHPETRLWVLTAEGELRVLLKEPTEDVRAWSRLTIDGTIEDIAVIPAEGEDEIWVIVNRSGTRMIEKLSQFGSIEPMDSFVRYTSPGTATLTGLTHLEGETVGVWADSQDRGTFTVASGQITVPSDAYTNVVVGLPYTATYNSNKLSDYIAESVIGETKRVTNTALVMRNYSPDALQVGRDSTHLTDLPRATAGALVTDYDDIAFAFPGTCDTDSRIYLQATGPCTIMALSYQVNMVKKESKSNA